MTNRHRSATTRSVPAQTPEQLLEVAQEHIRPLIRVIDQFNEADAEDEQTAHAAVLQGRKSRLARHRAALIIAQGDGSRTAIVGHGEMLQKGPADQRMMCLTASNKVNCAKRPVKRNG